MSEAQAIAGNLPTLRQTLKDVTARRESLAETLASVDQQADQLKARIEEAEKALASLKGPVRKEAPKRSSVVKQDTED